MQTDFPEQSRNFVYFFYIYMFYFFIIRIRLFLTQHCCQIWGLAIVEWNFACSVSIVCTLPFCWETGAGCWASYQIFKNGRLKRIPIFRGGLLGKTGWRFSGSRLQFYIKNKPKSQIFNDNSVITKNLNWEISTKNLVTFK